MFLWSNKYYYMLIIIKIPSLIRLVELTKRFLQLVVAMQLDQGRNIASAVAEFVKGDTFEVTFVTVFHLALPKA